MKCKDCVCSDVCYYKAFNDVRAVKKRDDVEKICKSFVYRDSVKVDAVEVVHARNLRADSPSLFECSECGWSDCDTYTGDTAEYNYCPNCGAKMDGGSDNG